MLRRICPILLLLVFILFLLPNKVFAENLIVNPSFETITDSSPSLWIKSPSTATLLSSDTSKSGSSSAAINKTNNSTGLIYAYQDIDVEGGSFYTLSGSALKNNTNFNWVILRISWRDSSSNEASRTDSSQLTSDSSSFQDLQIQSVQAPSQAAKARVELATYIGTQNPSLPVLFDDIYFSQISPPEQPQSTPTPTPSPQNSPTSTPIPTKSPTPTPKPSTPAPSISLDNESSEEAVLGESSESAAMDSLSNPSDSQTTKGKEIVLSSRENNIGKTLIILGFVFILACGILFSWPHIRNKLKKNE